MNIEDLPEKYREQARERLSAQGVQNGRVTNKYRNVETNIGNIKFASKKEARRFMELKALADAGEITDLRLQHAFTLQESFTTPSGVKTGAIRYVADFTYYDADGQFVVEDVKGVKTDVYKIKSKMMAARGYIIREV